MFRLVRRLRNRPGTDRGAVLVEFALVAPLLVILLFGIVEFARAFNAKITYTHAAREAVRVLAVQDDVTAAQSAAEGASTDLNPASLNITFNTCSDSPGGEATANVSADIGLFIPFFGSPTYTITGSATMTCEP